MLDRTNFQMALFTGNWFEFNQIYPCSKNLLFRREPSVHYLDSSQWPAAELIAINCHLNLKFKTLPAVDSELPASSEGELRNKYTKTPTPPCKWKIKRSDSDPPKCDKLV